MIARHLSWQRDRAPVMLRKKDAIVDLVKPCEMFMCTLMQYIIYHNTVWDVCSHSMFLSCSNFILEKKAVIYTFVFAKVASMLNCGDSKSLSDIDIHPKISF